MTGRVRNLPFQSLNAHFEGLDRCADTEATSFTRSRSSADARDSSFCDRPLVKLLPARYPAEFIFLSASTRATDVLENWVRGSRCLIQVGPFSYREVVKNFKEIEARAAKLAQRV